MNILITYGRLECYNQFLTNDLQEGFVIIDEDMTFFIKYKEKIKYKAILYL